VRGPLTTKSVHLTKIAVANEENRYCASVTYHQTNALCTAGETTPIHRVNVNNQFLTMAGKVALVTGITGQDGSYLAEFLLEKGYTVSCVFLDPMVSFQIVIFS
jgi:hypothetical protein